MLLRSSRAAERLTKEALLGSVAGKAARFAGRHWKGIGGTALVGTTVAPEISSAARKSRMGLTRPWLQASAARAVPSVPSIR